MQSRIGLPAIVGFFGFLAVGVAQTPSSSAAGGPFDGTYRFVSSAKVNATYVARNGRTGPCPERRAGPLHVANGQARYTTTTGYKLRGTVGPQGELELHIVAPPNSNNAGSSPIDLVVNGTIDGSGAVRARQTSHSCSYDFVWQKSS